MSEENNLKALVTAEHRQAYRIFLDGRELPAQITGKLIGRAAGRLDFPTVGDWVSVSLHDGGEKAVIHEVLARKSILVRKEAGTGKDAQPIAANVDRVFVVMGLDGNYNIARLERLLVAVWDSGAVPAVILTKKDLCPPAELPERLAAAAQAAPGAEVLCVCGVSGEGVDGVRRLLSGESTCCFLGSSGVGKSTLLNSLCGYEAAATQAVREDDSRGRHTTVSRQLYFLPGGARIIDTPGVREFCLDYAGEGLAPSFADVEELAAQCRFGNCSHQSEPGCAVKAAIDSGALAPERLNNYRKMQRETARNEAKHDATKRLLEKRKFKAFARQCRGITETKRKLRGGGCEES